MPAEIKLYGTTWCGYCHRAKRLLNHKGLEFEDISVDGDAEARRWLAELTGSGTVPQIFINGISIGGSDELHMLERSGKLDAMLES